MLKPSYTQIMQKLDETGRSNLTSRYSIVIAAAKRARNIIDIINEDEAAVKDAEKAGEKVIITEKTKEAARLRELLKTKKPVSIAVDEIYEGKMKMKEYRPEVEEEAEIDEA